MCDVYKKAKELFEKELEKLVDQGDISEKNLPYFDKVVDIIKDIDEICEKEDGYEYESSDRRGYGMNRSRTYPYMGSYTVEGNYGNRYSGAPYDRMSASDYMSRGSRTSAMQSKLQRLMDESSDDHERMMVQTWMNEWMNEHGRS